MSHKERFFTWSNGITYYAPSTIGCPAMIFTTDHSCFKKSIEDRSKLFTLKKQLPKTRNHKFKVYMKESF